MQQTPLNPMPFQKKFGTEKCLSETFIAPALAGGISLSPLPTW